MSCVAGGNPAVRMWHNSEDNRGERNVLQRRSDLFHARMIQTVDSLILGFHPLLTAARGPELSRTCNVSRVHVCEVASLPEAVWRGSNQLQASRHV